MEPEEIAVVLARASELHSKLNDAISFVVQDAAPSLSPSSSRIQDLQNGDGSSELRSLASIRDALEVLEEQLEALQALQQQQRADRDAGLAEIEESRRGFLRQLNDYRGRELEIVQEALAFAGGSIPDKDELLSPSYPHVDNDESSQVPFVSLSSGMSGRGQRQDLHEGQHRRNEMFGFEVEEVQEEGSEGDSTFEDDDERGPDSLVGATMRAAIAVRNSVACSGVFVSVMNAVKSSVALLGHLGGQISGQVTGPSSKMVLIVVSTLAVLSLTDLGERRTKSVARVSRMPAHRSHQHHICDFIAESSSQAKTTKSHNHGTKANLPQAVDKPPVHGENLSTGSQYKKSEDDFPNCVVRERVELPFYQELQTPDILHGRG